MYRIVYDNQACEMVDGLKRIRVFFVSPEIVRISYIEADHFVDGKSHIVTATDGLKDYSILENQCEICLSSDSLKVTIHKSTGAIKLLDSKGNVLHREPESGGKFLSPKEVYQNIYDQNENVSSGYCIDGARAESVPSKRVFNRHAFEAKLKFKFDKDEALFGLGSHEEGYGNLRGKSQLLYQHNLKAVVPCIVSTKGYGLLWDCGSVMAFHDDAHGSYLWAECVDQIDYYFIAGGNASAVAKNYYHLTGAPPMLPRWAFGYVQSKERYVNADEILDIAREYRRREIPLDVMVLDWKSWPDGNGWGQKSFDPVRFPDPKAFIDELHALDVKLMVSIWPIMTGNCENQNELRELGQMLGNQSTYNAFDSDARKTYWKQANEGLFSKGVDAWWCDCTEPFEADWHGTIKAEPHLRLIENTDEAKKYLDEGELSLYSLLHSRGIYEGQRSQSSGKRVINLTRSSYAGQHRYGTVSWSGDICATWEVLKRSIPEGVNFCATGEPYWTVDIGAFFVGSDPENRWFWKGDYEEGCRGLGPMDGADPIEGDHGCLDKGYWELYARWLQFGCFLPMFRSHGTDAAREIWRFGEKGDPFYDTIAKYIRFRYQLIPYIYSVASAIADTGLALLRPVAMGYPHDPQCFDIEDQYFFGPSVMVCPVTKPMYFERGSKEIHGSPKTRKVYLPSGNNWYDFWSKKIYPGGATIEASAPLEDIPLFVPEGSVILMGPVSQHCGAPSEQKLELHVYTGLDANFVWYEDDGNSYKYENGEFSKTLIHWNESKMELSFSDREGSFAGIRSYSLNISLHFSDRVIQCELDYEGSALKYHLDKEQST